MPPLHTHPPNPTVVFQRQTWHAPSLDTFVQHDFVLPWGSQARDPPPLCDLSFAYCPCSMAGLLPETWRRLTARAHRGWSSARTA